VVAPIYRDRAKQIAERIGKISLKSCEKTLSDDGTHQIYAELDPLFHDVLSLIKRASQHGPGLPLLGVLQELTMTPSITSEPFGKLHEYAKILTNRISNISKYDDRIDRLLLIYNSATGAKRYCNAANDIVQDTLEDQSDSFEVYGPFGFAGLENAFMNVCVEARTEIVTSIRNTFWNQINEKEYVELYSSSSSTSHAMASVCDAIEASSISKIKASLVSYSFSVYLPFMHSLSDSILKSYVTFLEDVVSPLTSADRAVLDVMDLAAFLKDLPIRCPSSSDLQARCEAMFEKYENALEAYGDRVLNPVLLIQKVLTMTKSDDVLKSKSSLISALGFYFPEFKSLISNDEDEDDGNDELKKLLRTTLQMLIRFRGGEDSSCIGSDTREFIDSILSSSGDVDDDGVTSSSNSTS
jgi:hypothetical protein